MTTSPRPKYTPKPGSGSMFPNKYKTEDRHPYWKGTVTLPSGEQMRIAAWTKQDRRGVNFLSLQLEEDSEEAYREAAQPVNPADSAQAPLDDEIPF